MIGIRALLSAILALALPAAVVGGEAGPWADLVARDLVLERARSAIRALDALDASLAPALEAGRRGSARVVAGDEPPGPELARAAELVEGAATAGASTRQALGELEAARRAADPMARPLSPPVATRQLPSIAAQLEAAAEAADIFASMRATSASVTLEVERALESLEAERLDEAAAAIGRARTAYDAVAGWEVGLATLPIWLETADAMIVVVETIIERVRAGDGASARAAAERLAAVASDARTADRALRIALSEGGAAVAGVPLARLAGVIGDVRDARAAVESIMQAARR